MKQIVSISQVSRLVRFLRNSSKTMVIVGGCFDILHLGHIIFLEKAKSKGNILIVLLESDQAVKKLKGNGRPINNQLHRAKLLCSLRVVDYVIMLPTMVSDNSYDQLIKKIKPEVIAATAGDSGFHHKKRQAKLVGARLLEVTNLLPQKSTTVIEEIISKEI